jgi:hypothetical protein
MGFAKTHRATSRQRPAQAGHMASDHLILQFVFTSAAYVINSQNSKSRFSDVQIPGGVMSPQELCPDRSCQHSH